METGEVETPTGVRSAADRWVSASAGSTYLRRPRWLLVNTHSMESRTGRVSLHVCETHDTACTERRSGGCHTQPGVSYRCNLGSVIGYRLRTLIRRQPRQLV